MRPWRASPYTGARKLARSERGVIGITPFSTHASSSPYSVILFDSIQEVLVAEGYAARTLEPDRTDLTWVSGFIVPGIFTDDSRLTPLLEREVVTSVIWRTEGQGWVAVDNKGDMTRVMQHLIKLGHHRIVHLTATPIGQESFYRLEAYQHTRSVAGLEAPKLILGGRFTELGGYRALRTALADKLEFTAVAAASDEMALGAVLALQDAGLRIPYDVSVTGFDGLPYFDFLQPQLTTVRQPIHELGRAAAQRLLELLEGHRPENQTLPTELIVRGSSGPVSRSSV